MGSLWKYSGHFFTVLIVFTGHLLLCGALEVPSSGSSAIDTNVTRPIKPRMISSAANPEYEGL